MNPYLKSCIVEKENKESTFVSPSIKMGLLERSRYSCFKEVKCKWADDLERIASQSGGKNLTQFSLDSEASQNFRETAHPLHHSLGFNSDTISLMHSSGNSGFERNLYCSGSAIFFSLFLTVRDQESFEAWFFSLCHLLLSHSNLDLLSLFVTIFFFGFFADCAKL